MKPLSLSPELEAVVGKGPLPRSEVVKKLWDYIKKNNLQDPSNKRNIVADEKLKKVFGGKAVVNMFEMTKLVSKHLS
ncbi:MAG TPA: SWIB/MDM2 domain-containing protein [bacterium]|nr:SWIB/MDM2 domain-containing protein [bacterium]